MTPGGQPSHPFADSSVPAMQRIMGDAKRRDFREGDFSSDEDAITRWRALAVFGGLGMAEGLLLASDPTTADSIPVNPAVALLVFGGIVLFFGIWVGAAVGGEYVWAILAAVGLSAALGVYFGEFGPAASVARAPITWGLVLGGVTLLILSLARSIQVGRQLDPA